MLPGSRCENGNSVLPSATLKVLGLEKKFQSKRSSTWVLHLAHLFSTGRLVVFFASRYIVTFVRTTSQSFGVICSLPEIIAPVDCCGDPMKNTGGLSMCTSRCTGFARFGDDCLDPGIEPGSDILPCLSFDRDRWFLSEECFFAKETRPLGRLKSMLASAIGVLVGDCFV